MSAYIYGIKNKTNNLYYIGQTINKNTRKWRHFNELRKGSHPNKHLQNAYNKDGEANFEFIILEEVEDYSRIKEREDSWIDKIGYYNIDKGRSGFTPVALRNMSEAQKGKISSRRVLSEEQVLDFLSIEEFIGEFSRPFSRQVGCNRIVPKGILRGECYQEISVKYNSLELSERKRILESSIRKYTVETSRLTEKTAACVWFLYKNKQETKAKIAKKFNKNIRSIERILNKDTLKNSYEIYSRLDEDYLEVLTQLVIDNIVPSSKEKV